jgi:hypothetical protein
MEAEEGAEQEGEEEEEEGMVEEDAKGKVRVLYRFSENSFIPGRGRLYPIAPSLVYLPKHIRNTFCRHSHLDIDNCHPTLIWQFAGKHNLPHSATKEYCDNRSAKLEDIQQRCNCNREQAKNLVLVIMYGGSIASWIRTWKFLAAVAARVPAWVKELERETRAAGQYIFENVEVLMGIRPSSNFSARDDQGLAIIENEDWFMQETEAKLAVCPSVCKTSSVRLSCAW